MISDQELFQHIESSIRTVLKTKPGEISLDSSLVNDLGAESIDFLDISCELEKLIKVEVDFKQIMKTVRAKASGTVDDLTVGDVVNSLRAQFDN